MCNETRQKACSLLLKNIDEECSKAIYRDEEFVNLQNESIRLYHELHVEGFTEDLFDLYEDVNSEMLHRVIVICYSLGYKHH